MFRLPIVIYRFSAGALAALCLCESSVVVHYDGGLAGVVHCHIIEVADSWQSWLC